MLQYQPKLYQMCPSAYGVDATSIRIVIFLFVIERHARSVSNYVTSFVCVHSIPYINLVLMTFFLLRRVTTPCFHSPIAHIQAS